MHKIFRVGLGVGALWFAASVSAGPSVHCAGDPLITLDAFQQAMRGAQSWDDTGYATQLTGLARQRLDASRAQVDFSKSLGQAGPLQGWTPQQTLEQRQATALRMLQQQVVGWPLQAARIVHRGGDHVTVVFDWAQDSERQAADASTRSHRQHQATWQLRCESGTWRIDSGDFWAESRDVSTTVSGQQHVGSGQKESLHWP